MTKAKFSNSRWAGGLVGPALLRFSAFGYHLVLRFPQILLFTLLFAFEASKGSPPVTTREMGLR